MSCSIPARRAATVLRARCRDDPRVISVDEPLPPARGPTTDWSVEAVLEADCGGFPADLVADLDADATVRCERYNGFWRAVVLF